MSDEVKDQPKQDSGTGTTSNPESSVVSSTATTTVDSETSAKDDTTKEDDEFDGLTSRELRRLLSESQSKRKETDSELTRIKKVLDEKERAEKTENENLKNDVERLSKENAELKSSLEQAAIINAISQNKKFTFHDANVVAQNLKRSDLTVDIKTTKVEGIESALAQVAKDMPFLVVKSTKDEKTEPPSTGSSQGPTGFQPAQGGSKNPAQEQRGSLLKKYPILSNR